MERSLLPGETRGGVTQEVTSEAGLEEGVGLCPENREGSSSRKRECCKGKKEECLWRRKAAGGVPWSPANKARGQGRLRELCLGTHEGRHLGGRHLRREKTRGKAMVLWGQSSDWRTAALAAVFRGHWQHGH